MKSFIPQLREKFEANANADNARQMKAYMRNRYDFFGIKAPDQRRIRSEFLKTYGLPSQEYLPALVRELWAQPEREFQHFGMVLCEKYIKKVEPDFVETLEFMITNKSWWDTVDFIASHLVGDLFKRFPEMIPQYTTKWLDSENMWLQRTALLFQLRYKNETDTKLLFSLIEKLADHQDFFIRKAIGWALRQYSKTDPALVMDFVKTHKLSSLSQKEALKVIMRSK
ncbi:MAG: DNA alkylation repair protein [Bacteroidota bacterium]